MSAPDAAQRLALSLLVEPGDPRLPALLSTHGAAALVDGARAGDPALPQAWRARAVGLESRVAVAAAAARAAGMRWIVPEDAEWPPVLDDLATAGEVSGSGGPPIGVWVRGAVPLDVLARRAVAVVGARDATTYGCDVAGDLAADLAAEDVTIVSGGAFGIDAAAHRGALAVAGATLAVLACGADVDYPRAHAGLLRRVAQHGCLLTEYAPGATPTKGRFLARNRVIAALGLGTVVVEAARRSGALNTLGWAGELGRQAFAVPGPVTSGASVGTHAAIRSARATLVTSGAEVLEDLDELGARDARVPAPPPTGWDLLAAADRAVLDHVPAGAAASSAHVAQAAGMTVAEAERVLADLADRGLVRHEAGDAGETRWSLGRRAELD